MLIIHHYHPDTGAYVGSSEADRDPLDADNFLLPAHATTAEPPQPGLGFFAAWNGSAWELRDEPTPPPEPAPYVPTRAEQIRARLGQIDADSIRPARAVAAALAAGQPAPAFDAAKLATLETEAATLRAELAGLPA